MTNGNALSPNFQARDKWAIGWILLISVGALAFLVWLIYLRQTPQQYPHIFNRLPAVNAFLNAMSACCLVAGYTAIRTRRIRLHMTLMISAFVWSTLFLITYVIYHGVHGDTHFLGTGFIRPVYFSILISHIILSSIMLPLILTTMYFAFTKRFRIHKRIARVTLPIWLYVSVTGVVIYFMLSAHS